MLSEQRGGTVPDGRVHAAASPHARIPRRLKRLEETQQIKVRGTHRRRKAVTRSGVLSGFVIAMVVYPVMGTITPYADLLENVPGLVAGEVPSTAHALLGGGPQMSQAQLPLPEPDQQARAFLLSGEQIEFSVSQYLPDCDLSQGWEGTNGNLTDASLCTLWDGKNRLRADAAVALAELNQRFKLHFGRDMCISQGYRTYANQVRLRAQKGIMAAVPGRSMHGWGLAFDLCGGDDRGETKQWLEDNGPAWGWINPDWAKTRTFEPWHWEYTPGTEEFGVHNSWSDGGSNGDDDASDDRAPSAPADPAPTDPNPPAQQPQDPPAASPEPEPGTTTSAEG